MKHGTFSRRDFLKTALAAAGMPTIVPASVFGRNGTPPSDRVTLGHIGVGGRGGDLLNGFLQVEDAQSIAVCDCFQNRRQARAQQIDDFYAEKFEKSGYSSTGQYHDFRELLARPDIDAVVIATPDHWHVPIGIAAVRAGKHVYIEKPLGVSMREDQAMRQAVQETGAVFQYGTQQRSWRQFRFACELARNSYLGKLHTIHAWCPDISSQAPDFFAPGGSQQSIPVPEGFDYERWLGPAPWSPYTADRCRNYGTYHHYDNSLGFIAGWGAHPLDIAQWGNGTDDTAPVEYEGSGVLAQGLFTTVASWDFHCAYANGVVLRFMNEATAQPIVSTYHPAFRDHGTTFIGDDGWVSVDRYGIYAAPESLLNVQLRPSDLHFLARDDHHAHFIECVRTRMPSLSPVTTAVQSDFISHLCDISIRVRRKIRWNPATEEIIDDPEATRLMSRPLLASWRLW
jgi:predicted dehydrogenase